MRLDGNPAAFQLPSKYGLGDVEFHAYSAFEIGARMSRNLGSRRLMPLHADPPAPSPPADTARRGELASFEPSRPAGIEKKANPRTSSPGSVSLSACGTITRPGWNISPSRNSCMTGPGCGDTQTAGIIRGTGKFAFLIGRRVQGIGAGGPRKLPRGGPSPRVPHLRRSSR